jgi:hypothetical protein
MSIVNTKQLAKQIYNITGSFTGSFKGNGNELFLYRILTGSITASVGVNNIFSIKSGSYPFFLINNQGTTVIKSNAQDIIQIKNDNEDNVMKITQNKIINFITHSYEPTSSASYGDIWFTSSSLYLGLD